MSNITYDVLWREAMTDLLDQLETENPEDENLVAEPRKDEEVFQHHACLYIKYIQIFAKLEECYDQIVHPQKRIDIRKVLDSTMGRILEIKHILVNLRQTEYICLDDILVDLKLRPDVLEVPIPHYFLEERKQELDDRERLITALMNQANIRDPTLIAARELSSGPEMTLEQAIRIIQINERGRQGRQRAKYMRDIRREEEREQRRQEIGELEADPDLAAISIQKTFRGYLARKKTKMMREDELIFLGMTAPPRDSETDPVIKMDKNKVRRKHEQEEHQKEYEQAMQNIRQKMYELEGPDIRDAMQDKIRQWFIQRREADGKFPEYPAVEDDKFSSKQILHPPPPPTEEELAEMRRKQEEEELAKKKKGKKGKGAAKAKAPAKKAKGKGRKGEDEDETPKQPPLARFWVPPIQDGVAQYCRVWQDRDESWNVGQKHDPELVRELLRPQVEEEIRLQVDEALRVELENLKLAVERAKANVSKKKKKGKGKKGKKGKRGKKGGKGKGKKKKDLTANRPMDSLLAELVGNGICQKYGKVKMNDFAGDFNYLGSTMEKAKSQFDPSFAHIRQIVTEYCVLPLASKYVHEHAPLIRSILFYGFRGTGKTMLAHAVATESGSLFFNLTATNTDGKYTGKQVVMMMHMVFKVAKALAPSVIYIDDIDQVFSAAKKKGAKGKKGKAKGIVNGPQLTEPAGRIKKHLLSEMKELQADDRVLVIGTTRLPASMSHKENLNMVNFFNKMIFLNRPEYSTRQLIWRHLIHAHGATITPSLDMETLSHVSEGYSAGCISDAVRFVLTKRRLQTCVKRPLTAGEFIVPLSKMNYVNRTDFEYVTKWIGKYVRKDDKDENKEQDAKGKGKGKGKGKAGKSSKK